jgi:O-methyltransferase
MVKVIARGLNFLIGKALRNRRVFLTNSLEYLQRERKIDVNYFDYVRLAAIELVSAEIYKRNLNGSIAELGVYKGKFAKYINSYFPDRTFYLFDTFGGFDLRDIDREKRENFSSGAQDFSNTSIEEVLNHMPFREKCIPVKGFFPETARGVEDDFVFVSIDADLYEPIYSALSFFYPKLVKGGYIFIHDFNNDNYKGARRAVEQYCNEQKINFVPIPDSGGSAVIAK